MRDRRPKNHALTLLGQSSPLAQIFFFFPFLALTSFRILGSFFHFAKNLDKTFSHLGQTKRLCSVSVQRAVADLYAGYLSYCEVDGAAYDHAVAPRRAFPSLHK